LTCQITINMTLYPFGYIDGRRANPLLGGVHGLALMKRSRAQ
jgi:hypothetical protein